MANLKEFMASNEISDLTVNEKSLLNVVKDMMIEIEKNKFQHDEKDKRLQRMDKQIQELNLEYQC